MTTSNPLDDLITDDPAETSIADDTPDTSGLDLSLDLSLDLNCLDIGDLQTELDADRNAPLEIIHNPITGGVIESANVQQVVSAVLAFNSVMHSLRAFENEIKKAAMRLAEGTTKTRRLTAEVDGELQTIEVHMPGDNWPEQELGTFAAWCNRKDAPDALKKFYARFVREKVKIERSPILKEVKKLASEKFPEGSELETAKERLLKINKGTVGKLPRLKVQGDKLDDWEQKRFGDGDDAE